MRSITKKSKDLIIDYTPAEYCNNKDSYVQFYAIDPNTGMLKRKRIRLNRIKSPTERKKYAIALCKKLNRKLEKGWTPFIDPETPKGAEKLISACDDFLKIKKKDGRRPDTMRSYNSFVTILKEYITKEIKNKDLPVYAFKPKDAVEFLDFRYINFDITPTTFNNYTRFYRLLWNWFIKKKYVTINPFKDIEVKKQFEKARIIIDRDHRKLISDYLLKNDPQFYIVCMLCFHSLMRPKEIAQTRIKYINTDLSIIKLPSTVTKNGKARVVTVPYHLNEAIKQLGLHSYYPKNYFAFSSYKQPGPEPVNTRKIDKWWDKMRTKLDLPKNIQFYSLKDTGIVQLLEDGVSLKDVKDLADHASLSTTSKYLSYVRQEGIPAIKNSKSRF